VCWSNATGLSTAICETKATIVQSHWNRPDVVAHEWGHFFPPCLADEYVLSPLSGPPPLPGQCEHSLMGKHLLSNNLCFDNDHFKDIIPVHEDPVFLNVDPAWDQMISPVAINATPDAYNYSGHPLAGLVGEEVTGGGSGGGGSCRAVLAPLPTIGPLGVWLISLLLCVVQRRRTGRGRGSRDSSGGEAT